MILIHGYLSTVQNHLPALFHFYNIKLLRTFNRKLLKANIALRDLTRIWFLHTCIQSINQLIEMIKNITTLSSILL